MQWSTCVPCVCSSVASLAEKLAPVRMYTYLVCALEKKATNEVIVLAPVITSFCRWLDLSGSQVKLSAKRTSCGQSNSWPRAGSWTPACTLHRKCNSAGLEIVPLSDTCV